MLPEYSIVFIWLAGELDKSILMESVFFKVLDIL